MARRPRRPDFDAVSDPARRQLLQCSLGSALAAAYGPLVAGCASPAMAPLGFAGVPVSRADRVVVPAGYRAQVLVPWGEPVGLAGAMPAWREDAGNSASEQALQLGMHHDGMHYYELEGSRRGLLVLNHEYTDDGLLFPDGGANWSAAKVAKAQAAHGISVVEVERAGPGWRAVRPSPFARRVTATTPVALAGPVAGHALVRTAGDRAGRTVLGTLANCGAGTTPWGTYLSGEENWIDYFDGVAEPTPDQRRWSLSRNPSYARWGPHDDRFDAARHPNELHRFGWIVELDPMDPQRAPVKRTALGRGAHEGAWVAATSDSRAVVYTGEDARFEYLYKFVSRDRIAPGGAPANRSLLDHGTLYAARFDGDGSGRWLPLVHGRGPLTAANGFADQAETLVRTRQAADLLGATPMDRPEWMAIDPLRRGVYCTLTNNRRRGTPGQPAVDAANARADNTMGQIVRWHEDGDFDATTFRWTHLLLAGDPQNVRPEARGNIRGDAFGCPDGLAFDSRGVLWIATDAGATAQSGPEFARLGNNQLLACDVASGEVRRFLTGPVNAEIAGCAFTPDGRTMFVNVQHPGEAPAYRSNPADPGRYSTWPDGRGRPRSATVVVTREDGGVIGA